MIRACLTALAFCFAAFAASAFDIEAMTEQERDIFRSEIREYLLENPEVLMEAIAVLEERRAAEAAAQESAILERYRAEIFDDGYSWVGGNPDGDVTIVEFLDYRCGFCKKAHPEVQALLEGDGNIRMIVKEFPILGEQSVLASRYAISVHQLVGDEAYGGFHDALMEWQGDVTEGTLARLARDAGLDHDQIVAHMNTDAVTKIIEANRRLGAALQIQGTPSFVMGDNFVRGYVDLEQMRSIVESIRAEAG